MNRLITLLMASMLLGGLVAGCTFGQPREYADPSQGIEIVIGEQFIIALESNPTTGYTWETGFDESFLRLVQSEFKPGEAAPSMVGVGGERRFTFKGLKEGETELTLTYKRSWEQDSADQKVFAVSIK